MTTAGIDAVTLSVLASSLSGVAEEMGVVLIRSAYSSNIKERRDCSAALFDAGGRMVAQAEHIPAHLGAMPEAVRSVLDHDPGPGDVFLLNDPYTGSNHLPDLTLVSTIDVAGEVVGFGVTRAHHAEIGGMRPGSIPSDSREIYQEGLIIPPTPLVRAGTVDESILALILANVRTPQICRGDLRAQVAAGHVAQARVNELFTRHGPDMMHRAFDAVLDYTERCTREAITRLPDGVYTAASELEGDGTEDRDIPIRVSVRIDGDRMAIDFTGTSGAVAGNVNCPLAVTRSACLFVLRMLLPADVPVNGGMHRVLEVNAEPGCLVSARHPSAVVAGNMETSQRIADTVALALAQAVTLPAQGQGTMNNLIIGGPGWSYYETIGGGQGASACGPGDSGVHVGMSNTLNTPVEALELEYPMRVERYELAGGRGGDGQHRGGDGIDRTIRLLAPASVSIIADRRGHRPAGAAGGAAGEPGENLLNGEPLPPKVSFTAAVGDVVTIRSPGGGGYGEPRTGSGGGEMPA
jgi:N-methylhydantoinase B